MGISLVTAAASLPVVLADISPELNSYEQSTANDAIVNAKLYEATDYIQSQTQRQFIQATWLQTFDSWPFYQAVWSPQNYSRFAELKIDLQPLSSVTTVKYYDVNATLQTVSSSDYWVDTNSKPPRVVFKQSFGWPVIEIGRPSGIQVTYVAGYANAAAVPYMAKLAIKLLAAYWYNQREAVTMRFSDSPSAVTPAYGDIPYGVTQIINMLHADGYT